jgi:hypothetical protein
MKGNCFIDIDGIYDYHYLLTFFSCQSMKIIPISATKVVTEIFLKVVLNTQHPMDK